MVDLCSALCKLRQQLPADEFDVSVSFTLLMSYEGC